MNWPKRVFFKNWTFTVEEQVYEPAEDTFLLANNLAVTDTDVVLDVGTGCGILAIIAAQIAKKVVAVDVNPFAIRCAQINARANGVEMKVEFRVGNLFAPIKANEQFTLITFNAPYLPCSPHEETGWVQRAWSGGPTGREVIEQFITHSPHHLTPGGRLLLVQSTLSQVETTLQKLRHTGLQPTILAWTKVPFEKIVLIRAEKSKDPAHV